MANSKLRLGELLINSGVLTKQQLEEALTLQKEQNLRLGTILLHNGFVSESHLIQALSHHLSIPWVSLKLIDISDNILKLVPVNVTEEFFLIPIYIRTEKTGERALYVAMNDPTDSDALRFVQATSGMNVKPMLAAPSDIAAAIRYYYYNEEYIIPNLKKTSTNAPASPIPVDDDNVEDLSDEMEIINVDSIAPPPEDITEQIPAPDVLDDDLDQSKQEKKKDQDQDQVTKTSQHPVKIKIEEKAKEKPVKNKREVTKEIKTLMPKEKKKDLFENKETAQREAERRIYGVGHSKQNRGFALTLLDGTTLSFNPGQNNPEQNASELSDAISKENFLASLKAAANGTLVDNLLPAEKWQSYMAAMLSLLFKKGLFMYDEFLKELESIENNK